MLAIVELGELAIIAAEPSADGEHPLKCRKRAMRLCCEAQLAQSMNQAPVVRTHRSPVAPTSAVRHGQQSLPPRLLCCSASGDLVGNYISTPSWRNVHGETDTVDAGQLMLQCGSGVLLDALRLVVGDVCLSGLCNIGFAMHPSI